MESGAEERRRRDSGAVEAVDRPGPSVGDGGPTGARSGGLAGGSGVLGPVAPVAVRPPELRHRAEDLPDQQLAQASRKRRDASPETRSVL